MFPVCLLDTILLPALLDLIPNVQGNSKYHLHLACEVGHGTVAILCKKPLQLYKNHYDYIKKTHPKPTSGNYQSVLFIYVLFFMVVVWFHILSVILQHMITNMKQIQFLLEKLYQFLNQKSNAMTKFCGF